MTRGFATLLGFAVLTWSAADAPVQSPPHRADADAAPAPQVKTDLVAANPDYGKLYVDQWLAEHAEGPASYDPWQPIEVATSDYDTYTADNIVGRRGGGASADTLLAALDAPHDGAGNRFEVGALPDRLLTGYISGFYGLSGRAFTSPNGGGSGRTSSGKNGNNGGHSGSKDGANASNDSNGSGDTANGSSTSGNGGSNHSDGSNGKPGTGGAGNTGGNGNNGDNSDANHGGSTGDVGNGGGNGDSDHSGSTGDGDNAGTGDSNHSGNAGDAGGNGDSDSSHNGSTGSDGGNGNPNYSGDPGGNGGGTDNGGIGNIDMGGSNPPPVSVPEPGTLTLFGLGLLGLGLFRRRTIASSAR